MHSDTWAEFYGEGGADTTAEAASRFEPDKKRFIV